MADNEMRDEAGLEKAAADRAFGAANRNRLINSYFDQFDETSISPGAAWQHVYRLLLWSDPTTGLAHCYESDKSQPGKPWYARSLAFHDWISSELGSSPANLAQAIDWLFVKACEDLTTVLLRKEEALSRAAEHQRHGYSGRGFPEPGEDPELVKLIGDTLRPYLRKDPDDDAWRTLTQRVRGYLAVQNKRKNLVGEGFEDVLAQVVRRTCGLRAGEVVARQLLYHIPGFNRARTGGKENKVDLAIVQPSMRTIVTAKWSVRADREKQFGADYEEYINAASENRKFEYVFVTNEFDPARLMRACEALYSNNPMFDHVVHISTGAVRAAYGAAGESGKLDSSWRKVIGYIDSGRLIGLDSWLALISAR